MNNHHSGSTLQHRDMPLSPRYFNDVPILNMNAAIHNRPSTEHDAPGKPIRFTDNKYNYISLNIY